MTARARIRRTAKWAGLILSVGLIGVWATSVRTAIAYVRRDYSAIGFDYGNIQYSRTVGPESERLAYLLNLTTKMGIRGSLSGWYVVTRQVTGPLSRFQIGLRFPTVSEYAVDSTGLLRAQMFLVPIWLPLLLIATPTAWLWYRDRRRIPAGHCWRCGYDLTKNESGQCPECGVCFARTAEDSR